MAFYDYENLRMFNNKEKKQKRSINKEKILNRESHDNTCIPQAPLLICSKYLNLNKTNCVHLNNSKTSRKYFCSDEEDSAKRGLKAGFYPSNSSNVSKISNISRRQVAKPVLTPRTSARYEKVALELPVVNLYKQVSPGLSDQKP